VVCMGDINGVVVGQEVHRNLMLRHHVYQIEEEMILGAPPPKGKTWAGIYIDDLAVLQFGDRELFRSGKPLRDLLILRQADAVSKRAGLLEKEEKSQRLLLQGKVWGASIQNRDNSKSTFSTAMLQEWKVYKALNKQIMTDSTVATSKARHKLEPLGSSGGPYGGSGVPLGGSGGPLGGIRTDQEQVPLEILKTPLGDLQRDLGKGGSCGPLGGSCGPIGGAGGPKGSSCGPLGGTKGSSGGPSMHMGTTVGCELERIADLCKITWATVAAGVLTKKTGQKLLGHWGFPLQFRRCLYALLDNIFIWVESLQEDLVYDIPGEIQWELLALSFTAIHMRTRLDTPVCNVVGATDACDEQSFAGLGGCEALVPQRLAEELFRRSDPKGERVKLGQVLQDIHVLNNKQKKSENWVDVLESNALSSPRSECSQGSGITGFVPKSPSQQVFVAVHMFSGRRRSDDFHEFLQQLSWEFAFYVHIEDYDITIKEEFDLYDDKFYNKLLSRGSTGQIAVYLGGPPCNTWSLARYAGPPGPPPLRSRAYPWGLPHLSGSQKKLCQNHDILLLRHIELCKAVGRAGGLFLTEHPDDPGPPYPSIFATSPVLSLEQEFQCSWVVFDQCRFDASGRKRTRLHGNIDNFEAFGAEQGSHFGYLCCHGSHKALRGLDDKGKFKTSIAQEYPGPMNKALAQTVLLALPNVLCSLNASGDPLSYCEQISVPVKPDLAVGDQLLDWHWKYVFEWRCDPNDKAHINEKELRAARTWIRRMCRAGARNGRRLVLLCDSRVATGAVNRGRSPAKRINRLLKTLVPFLVGAESYISVLWIPSKANPSDPISRGSSLWRRLKSERFQRQVRRQHGEKVRMRCRRRKLKEFGDPASPSEAKEPICTTLNDFSDDE